MKRLPMRKIREALPLQAAGLSKRQISECLGLGRTAAREYLERAKRAGLGWPLPDGLGDEALEQRLFPAALTGPRPVRPPPDWPAIHQELKRPGVTLSLLWEEYRAIHPDGYGYSRFCELYCRWKGSLSPTSGRRRASPRRGRSMSPATRCSSTMPGRPSMSWTD